ncbi:unnamed protein product [Adineta steineri]|uniref:F-box domain-containing protein n=1 Tax=Adineta steineri TaxID=433720 RepID=A0A818R276_9BILA|nr:unnamed protein product [Adineta steineri]CAF3648013.1 unnamed protein product [Adineta steineri]
MMSEQHLVSLLTLPTELLYRICDFLDTETIILSFRHVCVQLFAVTETYNRYKIHCNSTSTTNICRIISPRNIISLNFENEKNINNWIELFLSITDIYQFNRLRSFSIRHINDNNLNIILHHISINCKLASFFIYSDILQDNHNALKILSSIIAQPSLHNVILNFNLSNKDKFLWPLQSMITNLSCGTCTIKQFCSILQQSPYLHTLTIDTCQICGFDENFPLNTYTQLNSLTINDMQMTMDKLEFFLSFLPSLTHFDLTSSGKPFEFVQRLSRWEEFIRYRLPRLNQFEFCIFCYCTDWENFDKVIAAFRTPFWLEEKHWFVTCQFRDDWTSSFTIFTSPKLSNESYRRECNFDKVICSE